MQRAAEGTGGREEGGIEEGGEGVGGGTSSLEGLLLQVLLLLGLRASPWPSALP